MVKIRSKSGGALISTAAQREVVHADLFKADLQKCADAAIGVIAIRTREPYQCQESIAELAAQTEHEFRVWTLLTGWQTYPSPSADGDVDFMKPVNKDQKYDILKALDAVEAEFPSEGFFVLMSPQHWFDNAAFQQHIKAHARRALENNQRLILLLPEVADIPPAIEDDIHILDYRTPSHAELKALWDGMLTNIQQVSRPTFSGEQLDAILQNALGMSANEFDTALATAFVELRDKLNNTPDEVVPQDFIDILLQTKIEVIKKTDLLELLPSVSMDRVGGLDLLKTWVGKRKLAFSDAAREYGIERPKGILTVGPPGSGKSLLSKAVASVLGVPCVRFDIGRVFGQYVGQSEARIRKALKMVESMAPCVLFMDEIDKGLGGVGSSLDSGTTSRVFGTFLTWLQERKQEDSPIFVVMTANNISGMPPELLRKGRLDEIFAVTFPTEAERTTILKIHLAQRGHGDDLTDADLREVAKRTSNFVGAELEAIVKDALVDAFDPDDVRPISKADLIAQADSIIPLSKSFAAQVAAMNEWAKNNAKPASKDVTFGTKPEDGTTIRRAGGLRTRRPLGGKPLRPSRSASED